MTSQNLTDKDLQVMHLIAESAASRAVEKASATLRREMKEVASDTAEIMVSRLSTQIVEMEHRLRDELGTKIDSSIRENLGMSRDDHVQQHRQLGEMIEAVGSMNRKIWSHVLKAVAVVGLAAAVGTSATDGIPSVLPGHKSADRPAVVLNNEGGK